MRILIDTDDNHPLNESGHLGTSPRETEEECSGSSIHSERESRGVLIYICMFACNVHILLLTSNN